MTVAPACPHCHLIHATDWAVAVDRWRPEGPAGYRARYPRRAATRHPRQGDRRHVRPPCRAAARLHLPRRAPHPRHRPTAGHAGRHMPIRPLPTRRALHFHAIQPDQGCLIHGGNPS